MKKPPSQKELTSSQGPSEKVWQDRRWASADRIYVATLEQDLLGDWVVTRYWSGKHKRGGQVLTEVVNSYAEGCERLDEISRRRLQRGYRLLVSE